MKSEKEAGEESWRSLAAQRPESFETADEALPKTGEPWLPSLLFVKREVLLSHASRLLDISTFPLHDPRRSDRAIKPEWPFAWLHDDALRPAKMAYGAAQVHTTLDCNTQFNAGRWGTAARQLAMRQPALPLLSTLALYIGMLQRRGEIGPLGGSR